MDEWPGRKTNKLGSIVRVSGPLRYWPVLVMTIADGLLKQDRAVGMRRRVEVGRRCGLSCPSPKIIMLTLDIELMPDDGEGIKRWPSDMGAPSA